MEDSELTKLAKRQKELKGDIDVLESKLKELRAEYDGIRKRDLPQLLEEQGIEGVKLEGIGTLSLTDDLYANVPASQRGHLNEWLTEQGESDLIVPTVHSSTLKAFIKGRIEQGQSLPPDDVVKVTPYSYVRILKR
tara:strand:+ start:2873 stop:3280 length:408 start_codon:yes stop_codon:yes gene_type:complete